MPRPPPLPASVRAVIGAASSLRGRALWDALATAPDARVDLLVWAYATAPREDGREEPTLAAWAATVGISAPRLRAYRAERPTVGDLSLPRTGRPRWSESREAIRQRGIRARAKSAT